MMWIRLIFGVKAKYSYLPHAIGRCVYKPDLMVWFNNLVHRQSESAFNLPLSLTPGGFVSKCINHLNLAVKDLICIKFICKSMRDI